MTVQAQICVAGAARQSASEEIANTATHAAGLLLSLASAVPLIVSAHHHAGPVQAIGCGVYICTLIAVYAASSLLHVSLDPHWKHLFRIWDQGVIYLLIAGTYTPFALSYLRHTSLWAFLIAMWLAAGVGFLSKILFQHRVDAVSVAGYILLGWLPAVAMIGVVPLACIHWLLIGGICYTIGTPFLKLDQRFPYFHATWHVLVLAGSTCHYMAILQNVVVYRV